MGPKVASVINPSMGSSVTSGGFSPFIDADIYIKRNLNVCNVMGDTCVCGSSHKLTRKDQ